MKDFAFLIPFRTDNGRRQEIFNWNLRRLRFFFPDCGIYIGESPEGEFNRAAAINNAFSQIQNEKYVVINDSDTVWDMTILINGFHSLVHDARFVIPYSNYRALDYKSSDILLGLPEHIRMYDLNLDCEFDITCNVDVYYAPPVSGVCMMEARNFAKIKFDERFVGWGEEDVAFVIAARKELGRPYRCGGPIYHIAHPKSAEYSQPHYGENRRLLVKEYL